MLIPLAQNFQISGASNSETRRNTREKQKYDLAEATPQSVPAASSGISWWGGERLEETVI